MLFHAHHLTSSKVLQNRETSALRTRPAKAGALKSAPRAEDCAHCNKRCGEVAAVDQHVFPRPPFEQSKNSNAQRHPADACKPASGSTPQYRRIRTRQEVVSHDERKQE